MSEDIVGTLKRRLASFRGKLTSFKNFLETLLINASENSSDEQLDNLQLEIRLTTFEDLLTKYDATHLEIIQIDTEENLNGHCEKYNDFENDYFQLLTKAKALLQTQSPFRGNRSVSSRESSVRSMPVLSPHVAHSNTVQQGVAIQEPQANSIAPKLVSHGYTQSHFDIHPENIETNANIQNGISHPRINLQNPNIVESRSSLVKLPTLQMKTYNGDPETFLSFFEGFKSLVHNNDAFDDVTRLLYLKSVLGNEPSKVIESLDLIPANYAVALSLLEKRYKNTSFLIHSHIKGIVEFPKILKESAMSLRQLADSTQAHLRALESLGENVGSCASFVQYLITDKLDYNSKREWEVELAKFDNIPPTSTLINFIERRARLLEKIEKPKPLNQPVQYSRNSKYLRSQDMSYTHVSSKSTQPQSQETCPLCKEDHKIIYCRKFLDMSVTSRLAKVKVLNLCINCLRSGHFSANCRSGNCKKCDKRHSTFLHNSEPKPTNIEQETTRPTGSNQHALATSLTTSTGSSDNLVQVLPTAIVFIQDVFGKRHKCVALLDSASTRSYMTISLCSKLKLPTTKVNIPISGISQAKAKVSEITNAKIESVHSDFAASLSFLLLQNISGEFPPICANENNLHIPDGINLANPDYRHKTKVDILLGVDIFWQILSPNQSLTSKYPYLWHTQLGYIISGQFHVDNQPSSTFCHLTTLDLSHQLSKFWELENITFPKLLSPEEQQCESHFANTHKRDKYGKFVVSIPLNSSPGVLGESRQNALKLFMSLERRLQCDSKRKSMYIDFMNEYEALGHMTKVTDPDRGKYHYFIPHHGVYKEQSLTTKLRVVFNSSNPTSTGISFNDIQLNGPVLQDDLFSILLRFRRFKYVLTSDCEKMYRSVYIEPEQRSLQRIFWRADPSLPLQVYELCTVTYGEKSSSFLAIRCLFELANQCKDKYPEISKIIQQDMYCDDLLTSCDNLDKAKFICSNITKVLQSGGFTLRKWNSNHQETLDSIQSAEIANNILEFGPSQNTKTLGLLYNSYSDRFFFDIIPFDSTHKTVTKRSVLSYISMIFDPLGLLNPCTITARIFMQQLWLTNFAWDQALPNELQSQWKKFCQDLPELNNLRIHRQAICTSAVKVEMHAFSDGSKTAYGTCLYLRSINENNQVSVQLLCSKTRVAPLKPVTIPRLELCGALMMAQLVDKVKCALDIEISSITYWTDSTIVLSWINTKPHLLETFVSNRVVQIQALTDISRWKHITTDQNPADLVTRGITPQRLVSLAIWWHGPSFLSTTTVLSNQESPVAFPISSIFLNEGSYITCVGKDLSFESPIQFNRYSNLDKIVRIFAYCLRFIKNCRSLKENRTYTGLTLSECQISLTNLARFSQMESFSNEITILSNSKPLPKRNVLVKLNPFYDMKDKVIRVGGRLSNSAFTHEKKHPILISVKHMFASLLFRSEHIRLHHAGPSQLLSSIRDRFWPVSGRNLAKKTVFECITCFKSRPRDIYNLLGDLPSDRIKPQFPFSIVGTDYCGPFFIKDKSSRGWKPVKCYVCLFVCFSTKAVHLEPVTDLSSEAFILCLRRFASRRGMPSKIYSDNGRNYCGAKSQLDELGKFLVASSQELQHLSLKENLNWIFLPPYSPSLGGLWEAGIKSTKFHLKRVVGNATLSFEHFASVLTQVEGILNSRPLSPLSSHQNDLLPLTPSHFLIGRPITTVPDPDLSHVNENKLSLYQRIQQIVQNFWTRWSKEYISELQVRTRWQTKQQNVEEGTLVLIKDINLPPTKWKLGRVVRTISGGDGVVRIVYLRTQCGETSRAITKICPLPLAQS